jgi:predicted phosphodiesterase
MVAPACSEAEFIALWNEHRSTAKVAKVLNVSERSVNQRRLTIEKNKGIILSSPDTRSPTFNITIPSNGVRINVDVDDGVIIVGSDAHYWPGIVSTAHRAFVKIIKKIKPQMVIMNGDAFDGAKISRHPVSGFEAKPSVKQELEAVQERLNEIEKASGNAKLHWTWGNHDLRFGARIATAVPEYEGVTGFALTDHFPRWKFSTSVMVNHHTQIKHRLYNGIHAVYNAALKSGISVVTGHLHSLKVTPWTDLTGTRYGVDTGSLADVWGEQFSYTEDSTRNHRSGFVVLTFYNGKLMPPELCEVISEEDGLVYFRGEVISV